MTCSPVVSRFLTWFYTSENANAKEGGGGMTTKLFQYKKPRPEIVLLINGPRPPLCL